MKIRTKPWAKAVACILFVLSITSVLVTILPVNRLVYDGAYQSGGRENALENKEENLAMELTHQLTDIYTTERMGPNPSDYPLEELMGDPNFFFTIKDKNGKTVAASMHCMPHMANPTRSNNFDGHFCIHLEGSLVHENSKECPRHQAMVREAYRKGRAS